MKRLQRFLYSCRPDKLTMTNLTSLSGTWGGRWYIPDDKYVHFLNLYFEAIAKGEILRLVEKKQDNNQLFRMCADIDIPNHETPNLLPRKLMITIIDIFKKVISEYIVINSVQNITPIISCRLINPLKCHLNWPDLIVDNLIGRLIRNEVIDRLALIFLNVEKDNWSKWIDGNCYTLSGLRLLGSLKAVENEIQMRYHIISGYDELNNPLNPKEEISLDDILATSIRAVPGKTGDPAIILTNIGEEALTKIKERVRITPKTNNIGSILLLNMEEEPISELKLQYVKEGFVRSWTTNHYPQHLLDLFSLSEVKKFGDAYCMANKARLPCLIKGDYHNRETASHYHYMCPDGTSLRCHDETCKKCIYPSTPIPLPPDLKQFIYINVVNNINNGTINNYNDTEKDGFTTSVQLDFMSDMKNLKLFEDQGNITYYFRHLMEAILSWLIYYMLLLRNDGYIIKLLGGGIGME